ncbi:MAG: type II secretion system protein [Candidatus Saccharibacteria bacterium]|nr:type II secretion system protein [Candidatus Saccharibacteria bacterium]
MIGMIMRQRGFTIVELLIVIVIIGVLAAIVIVAYTGIQTRARDAKIQANEKTLMKAIIAARQAKDKTLYEITGNTWTADGCYSQNSGTNLAALDRAGSCWAPYLQALDDISTASGINVRALVDPWGRPYYIDENEGEDPLNPCQKDILSAYSYPFENYTTDLNSFLEVPLSLPDSAC